MTWTGYAQFLGLAAVLVLIPGPDFLVVTRNTLVAGKRRGRWAALGICTSNLLQGTIAAAGLGTVVVRVQPAFQAVRWAGVCYLTYLGVRALRSALRGGHPVAAPDRAGGPRQRAALAGWRQGFVSNVTNPKVLVFYLAVLPQFLRPGVATGWLLALAWSHAVLSVGYLLGLVAGLHRLRGLLARRRVRRAMDLASGTVLLGFGARLAVEHA